MISLLSSLTAANQNPVVMELGSSCTLTAGLDYCVQLNFGASSISNTVATSSYSSTTASSTTPMTTSVSTATTFVTTTSGDGISTPTPYQTGMASNCDEFYLVESGDECGTIAADEGISLDEFSAWNPAVGTSYSLLLLGEYVCVGIIGTTSSATTTTIATTTTATGGGITTPTPYQTGMVSDCDKFYLVENGDYCQGIATEYSISLENFYDWNPAVGTDCSDLELGDYVCVGVS